MIGREAVTIPHWKPDQDSKGETHEKQQAEDGSAEETTELLLHYRREGIAQQTRWPPEQALLPTAGSRFDPRRGARGVFVKQQTALKRDPAKGVTGCRPGRQNRPIAQ